MTGMSRGGRLLFALLAMLLAVGPADLASQPRRGGFPHAKHARLSPTCTGCHAGMSTTDSARFPTAASCRACHDGVQKDSVQWQQHTERPSLLRFAHGGHARAARPEAVVCQQCHADARDTAWMRVDRATPARCQSCHAHRAASHLAEDNVCAACHRTLTNAPTIPEARVAAFPTPESHARADFVSRHRPQGAAGLAQCATCHARESCARCHVNVATLAPAQALAPDVRVRSIVAAKRPRYPVPETHRADGFASEHGPLAISSTARCANCHAQPSCRTCHIGSMAGKQIAALPTGKDAGAPVGVRLQLQRAVATPRPFDDVAPLRPSAATPLRPVTVQRAQPPTRGAKVPLATPAARGDTGVRRVQVHPLGFEQEHSAAAASGELRCQGCHEKRWCADCHGGEGKRRYHVANFVARHAPESYGVQRDCAQCHNAEVFCRGCHVQAGLGTRGRLDEAFHTAQPLWLLQHGRAARASLESCTTCHTQRECMQCHSGVGRRVNPHGRDFNAARMATKNRDMCFTCHLTDPLRGR
jgi:hypothetical protein